MSTQLSVGVCEPEPGVREVVMELQTGSSGPEPVQVSLSFSLDGEPWAERRAGGHPSIRDEGGQVVFEEEGLRLAGPHHLLLRPGRYDVEFLGRHGRLDVAQPGSVNIDLQPARLRLVVPPELRAVDSEGRPYWNVRAHGFLGDVPRSTPISLQEQHDEWLSGGDWQISVCGREAIGCIRAGSVRLREGSRETLTLNAIRVVHVSGRVSHSAMPLEDPVLVFMPIEPARGSRLLVSPEGRFDGEVLAGEYDVRLDGGWPPVSQGLVGQRLVLAGDTDDLSLRATARSNDGQRAASTAGSEQNAAAREPEVEPEPELDPVEVTFRIEYGGRFEPSRARECGGDYACMGETHNVPLGHGTLSATRVGETRGETAAAGEDGRVQFTLRPGVYMLSFSCGSDCNVRGYDGHGTTLGPILIR